MAAYATPPVDVSEYAELDATALAGLIAAGEVSAAEVARRRHRRDRDGGAGRSTPWSPGPIPTWSRSRARRSPVCPFAAKDTLPEAGRAYGFGTALLEGYVSARDSTLAERFRAAGLQSVARTATPEFAFNFITAPRVHGPTRNPWDPQRSPGGSSGGSAALVAAGAVPIGHANDGGGSIRIPAAFCGLVGLKASRGRVPLGPAISEAVGGFAHEFAVTRTVRDAALLLDCVSGPSPGDRYYVAAPPTPFAESVSRAPTGLRIAVHTEAYDEVPTDPGRRGGGRERGRGPGRARPPRRARHAEGQRRAGPPRVRGDLVGRPGRSGAGLQLHERAHGRARDRGGRVAGVHPQGPGGHRAGGRRRAGRT